MGCQHLDEFGNLLENFVCTLLQVCLTRIFKGVGFYSLEILHHQPEFFSFIDDAVRSSLLGFLKTEEGRINRESFSKALLANFMPPHLVLGLLGN